MSVNISKKLPFLLPCLVSFSLARTSGLMRSSSVLLARKARHPARSTRVATRDTMTKGRGGRAPLATERRTRPTGVATAHDLATIKKPSRGSDVFCASVLYAPVKGAVPNHPNRNGSAGLKMSSSASPSLWLARPTAANRNRAAKSPAARMALRATYGGVEGGGVWGLGSDSGIAREL